VLFFTSSIKRILSVAKKRQEKLENLARIYLIMYVHGVHANPFSPKFVCYAGKVIPERLIKRIYAFSTEHKTVFVVFQPSNQRIQRLMCL